MEEVNDLIPEECRTCGCRLTCSIDTKPKSRDCLIHKKKYAKEED
jgi:hypothetical protein